MEVCDFARSFITIRIDVDKKPPKTVSVKLDTRLNNARMEFDSRCRVTLPDGRNFDYALGASCKGEQVNVPCGLWHTPNPDMCLIAGSDQFMVIKSWDRNNKGVKLYPPTLGDQPERQICTVADALDSLKIHLHRVEGRLLERVEDIGRAVLGNRRIIAQTEQVLDNGARFFVEYPIKGINVSEREHYYQVDTGPVLWWDGTSAENPLAGLQRAYIAHNAPDYAEFIVNVPTPLAQGISVNHYSRAVAVRCTNRLIELD